MITVRGRRVLVTALVTMLVITFGSAWALWFSPWLRIDQVQVAGLSRAAMPPVTAITDDVVGQPLIGLDTAGMSAKLLQLGTVGAVAVIRSWPNTVTVDVVERLPVAAVQRSDGQFDVLGGDARVVRTVEVAPEKLPELQVPAGGLQELTGVLATLDSATLARVQWATIVEGSVELTLRDDAGVVRWGAPRDNEIKGAALGVLMPASPEARWFDLSVPLAPVTALARPQAGLEAEATPAPPSPTPSGTASPNSAVERE